MDQSWLLTILSLFAVLLGIIWLNSRTGSTELTKLVALSDDNNLNDMNNQRNNFRTYFRKDTYQGKRVDWKPTLPYYHLTPDYGYYANQGKEECLDPGSPEL